jgi:hypothetical protein
MDLFQILILLFILFPILQKLFGGGKKNDPRPHRRPTGEQREPWQQEPESAGNSESWDDALRELESIFTGETTRETPKADQQTKSEPVKKPEAVRTEPAGRTQTPPAAESIQLRRQRELQERFDKTRRTDSILDEIADEDNPIFQSIDEGAVVDDDEGQYSEQTINYLGLNDTRELQRHVMLKEILDKPLSKRKRSRDMPF